MRTRGLWEIVSGALLWAAGVMVLGRAATLLAQVPGLPQRAPDASAPVVDRLTPSLPVQTLRESEPPEAVGEEFDDDRALPRASRPVASYTLAARLDDGTHTVDGHGTIVWENASSRPATELYFHLYLNAFKNSRTVFLRAPFGGGRSGHTAKHWGYIDVKRLRVREFGEGNVWPAQRSVPGEDPDETDVRVPLPRAVAPGERITLDVEWQSVLPEIVERTGYQRDFHMVGQWFPKIAQRSADGVWVHFPFHAQSEFYADFGSYDVTLDVPKELVVGATGALAEEHLEGARRRVRYHADDVHDFAWTAWKSFLERSETIDGVRVRLLYPPGNDANADATLRALRHGLRHFGSAFGRYPYPVLTVVHPPVWAPGASGMEYPTFITTGFPWYTSLASNFVERVTLHELGHQWFYGLVATDEHSWPFLDEGLTTYAESSAMKALFGAASGLHLPGLDIDGDAYLRGIAASAGHDDIVARPAADFVSFREIGSLVYARTGTILETMARVYGEAGLRRALGRYARRYRFEHPGPKHLIAVVREVIGDEPADFLYSALLEGGTVDFVAQGLQTTRERPAAGVFEGAEGRKTLETTKETATPSWRWLGRVIVYRHGSLRVPVDVELRLEDGSRIRKHWDGRGKWQAIECEGKSQLVAATVDPDSKILLDDDLSNNAVRSGPGTTARLVERALYAGELLQGAFGP
jgi:hypothetical protein